MIDPQSQANAPIYDYIIVGAGAAGCVLANRLSADPNKRVLLLEAGKPDDKAEMLIPAAFSKLFKTEYDWDYQAVAQPGLNGRQSYWAKGRTLGGSTSINAMMYLRGIPADYDSWEAQGATGWGWDAVLPYFKRSECNSRSADAWHSDNGPLYVEDLRDPNPLSQAFIQAAQAIGIPYNSDLNGPQLDGVGWVQSTQHQGKRWSAADAFLRPAMQRPNLEVITSAPTIRVLIKNRRAQGVMYLRTGIEQIALARGEVILAAGTVGSAQLLLLSGIGSGQHLHQLGIDVVLDLPGVGQNLRDHIAAPVVRGCTQPLSLLKAKSLPELLKYLIFKRGMLTSNVSEAAAFVSMTNQHAAPNMELQFAPVVFFEYGLTPPTEHGMTIGPTLLTPQSVGCMGLRSPDPRDQPLLDPRYLSDPERYDITAMIAGVRKAQAIFAAAPLQPYLGRSIMPEAVLATDQEIECYVRSLADGWWHVAGTCRMGSDRLSVVDPALRVHGIAGLRVADASVMPTVPRCHTMAPTIMIGEKAADLVLGKLCD
jgi:choline dehydrogenase